jgi:hypothetical protein
VTGKEERAGAHRNSGSTVRRRKRHRAAAFIGGEGALVGGDGGCGVLQHRRGKGVRKLQENEGIGSSGRSSPRSGGQRRCSAGIREGEWAAGGWRWRREDEWSSASGERAARRQRGRGGKRGGKGGGPGVGVPSGTGVPWGLAPPGGRCPATALARRSPLTDGAGLLAGAGRARARVGRPEKKRRRAVRMHSKVLHLFELD